MAFTVFLHLLKTLLLILFLEKFRKQTILLIMSRESQILQFERETLLKLWLEIKYARWSLGPLRWLSDFFCHVAQTDLCSLRPTAAHPSGHTCALSFLDIKKIAFSRLHNGRGYSQSALPLTLWKNLIFMLNVKQSSNVFWLKYKNWKMTLLDWPLIYVYVKTHRIIFI